MQKNSKATRYLKALFALAAAMSIAVVASACGGSSSDSGSNGGSTDAGLIEQSGEVSSMASSQLVYSAEDEPAETSQVEAYGEWRGPESAPSPKQGVKVEVIACDKRAVACVQTAEGAIEGAKAIGWNSGAVIDGGGSPQGWSRAFNTALSRNPDAIVAVGLTTEAVGDSLEKAKQQGVVTVVTSDLKPDAGTTYDAYVVNPYWLLASLAAWTEISETDGEANQIVVTDNMFEAFKLTSEHYVDVLDTCGACSSHDVEWQLSDALDPTKVNAIVGGALANNPGATGIVIPYGAALPNVIQAVAQAGKTGDMKVSNLVADQISLQAVAAGESAYTVGWSVAWAGWAAIDQVNRGLNDEPFLEGPAEIGIGVAVFNQSNAPASGDPDEWDGMVDYSANYERIWGID